MATAIKIPFKTSFSLKGKVYSAIEIVYYLLYKVKGVSFAIILGTILGLLIVKPLYGIYKNYEEIKNIYDAKEAEYVRKKNLIEGSLKKIKKSPPLPIPNPNDYFERVYAKTVLLGFYPSNVRVVPTTMKIKTLSYKALAISYKAKGYSDENLKRLIRFLDKGWSKLTLFEAKNGVLTVKVMGVVKGEEKRKGGRRFGAFR